MMGSRGLSSWRSLMRSRGAGSIRRGGDTSLLAGAARLVGSSTKATLQQAAEALVAAEVSMRSLLWAAVCLEQRVAVFFCDATALCLALWHSRMGPTSCR